MPPNEGTDQPEPAAGGVDQGLEIVVEGRHANNLELFLDLVFVFAVTQLSGLISHDLTVQGTLKGMLIAFLVWWQWSQFTWVGAAIDLQGNVASRAMVLGMIPVTLLMTISLPDAYHGTAGWFAWSYFGVQVIVVSMQGIFTWYDPELRRSFVRYASLAFVSPSAVVVGAYFHRDARITAWTVAALLAVLAALRGAGTWSINPTHFAERHALFIIIALGEVLVASGATAYQLAHERGLGVELAAAVVVVAVAASVLWWAYFAFIPAVGEHFLSRAVPAERGRLARDFYSFGHFPLVIGIVLFAVVVEHMLDHPGEPLAASIRWLLALSVAGFAGGLLLMRLRVSGRVSPERLLVIGLTALLCLVGEHISGLLLVALVAVLYAVSHAVRYVLFKREDVGTQLSPIRSD